MAIPGYKICRKDKAGHVGGAAAPYESEAHRFPSARKGTHFSTE